MKPRRLVIAGGASARLVKDGVCHRLPTVDETELTPDAETLSFGEFTAVSPRNVVDIKAENLEEYGLRSSWQVLSPEEYAAAVKGAELLNWNETERYCGSDGTRLVKATEISKRCPECGREFFPRLNPAIVVLVMKGEEALLVHSRQLKGNIHALVAGYVETGETLEECVAREVMEETSLEIEDIRYFGSQAWPFPYQMMVGFTARYKSGEIRYSDGELTSGAFFSRELLRAPFAPFSFASYNRRVDIGKTALIKKC